MFAIRSKSASDQSRDIQLPLAPMADVFIVVLIFILKGFSFDTSSGPVATSISLPSANAAEASGQDIRIEISKDEVLLNQVHVASLQDFRFGTSALDASGNITGLQQALAKVQNKDSAKLTLYADQKAPYQTIRSVLTTTLSVGLPNLQIAVANN